MVPIARPVRPALPIILGMMLLSIPAACEPVFTPPLPTGEPSPTGSATATETSTPTATPSPVPTDTPAPTPTPPPVGTLAPTATATPSATPTVVPGVTVAEDDSSITFTFAGGATLRCVKLPAGTFLMGSPAGQGRPEERPQHSVLISAFAIGESEVTQRQWVAVMGTNPSSFFGDARPVNEVSWEAATAFCRQLSASSGRAVRLPTEAEWEYACRAGTATKYSFGDDDSALGDYAWWGGNSGSQTHDVKGKLPNPWGLYDVHGNVLEWCGDWYDANYYASSPMTDPQGPPSGTHRVLRGGSWANITDGWRSAYRYWGTLTLRDSMYGLRIAVDTD